MRPAKRRPHHFIFGVLLQRLQRLDDRDAGLHHDRQLAGDNNDLLQLGAPAETQ